MLLMHPDSICPLMLEDWFPGKLQVTKNRGTRSHVPESSEWKVIVTERQQLNGVRFLYGPHTSSITHYAEIKCESNSCHFFSTPSQGPI